MPQYSLNITGQWTDVNAATGIDLSESILVFADGGNVAVAQSETEPTSYAYDAETLERGMVTAGGDGVNSVWVRATTGSAIVRVQENSGTATIQGANSSSLVLDGAYVPSRGAIRTIADNESLFGEQITTQRRPSISYNVAFGLSELRLSSNGTGSGSVSDATPGKLILSTGTTADSSRYIGLSEVGVYQPGKDAEMGIAARPQQALAGTAFARWGGLSAPRNDGFYFKDTADESIQAVRLKDSTEVEVVPRNEWNRDRFDGLKGPFNLSGIDINIQDGYIWQVDFTWYGYGIIVFGLVRAIPDALEKQRFIPGHVMQVVGDISISEPNLQVFAEINNGDQATDYKLDIGGMQYATLGPKEGQRRRNVDEYVKNVTGIGTGLTHLITFRRKSGFINRSVEILGLDLLALGEEIIFEIWVGGTVTGGTYASATRYTGGETSVETVTEQTFDETGAILVKRIFADPGEKNKEAGEADKPVVDLDLPDNRILTLTARSEDGNATVVRAQMELSEGW